MELKSKSVADMTQGDIRRIVRQEIITIMRPAMVNRVMEDLKSEIPKVAKPIIPKVIASMERILWDMWDLK